MYSTLKGLLLGVPKATSDLPHEKLNKRIALAVFSSDALSSVAYATEEILLILALAGSGAFILSLPIASAIIMLMGIVVFSYRQTITAYPNGGGAYIVSKENLGETTGLVAGASLLTDYILTVAVSIAAGTAAILSAFPTLEPYRIPLAVFFIWLIAFANLKGVKESGTIFAVPTYLFILSVYALIAAGLFKSVTGSAVTPAFTPVVPAVQSLSFFLILRAFSSGCAALTGIEAIANGVQAFKAPPEKNARSTLTVMGLILGSMFLGITLLARLFPLAPAEHETILSQLSRSIFGSGPVYFFIQFMTMGILILAANTSFADFPRLASIMAQDGYLPRQLTNRGIRLVFSNGIISLALFASILLAIFGGKTHNLIPLYAVGVFTSFTLSQSGMVVHWYRLKESRWKLHSFINGVGAAATFVVLCIIIATKFMLGAWIIVLTVPLMVAWFKSVKIHYDEVGKELSLADGCDFYPGVEETRHIIVIPFNAFNTVSISAIEYSMLLNPSEIRLVHVDIAGGGGPDITCQDWLKQLEKRKIHAQIEIIESPFRELLTPLKEYLLDLQRKKGLTVSLLLPELVFSHWHRNLLHNQNALLIREALYFDEETNIPIISFPCYLD